MKKPLEIRWHSRAGHGAITAAAALAEIIGKETGKEVQAFPDFGAEKRGASVEVFNRFSKDKINLVSKLENPDVVLLLDTTLVASGEVNYDQVSEGLKKAGKLIINTSQDKTKFSRRLKNVYHVNASKISTEEIGIHIPNVPMLGALIKITKLSSKQKFSKGLEKYLSKALPENIVKGNIKAFKRGYEEVRKI